MDTARGSPTPSSRCPATASTATSTGTVRGRTSPPAVAVVEVPPDGHLAAGGLIELTRLRRSTPDAFLELAALLADRFDTLPHAVVAGPTLGR